MLFDYFDKTFISTKTQLAQTFFCSNNFCVEPAQSRSINRQIYIQEDSDEDL